MFTKTLQEDKNKILKITNYFISNKFIKTNLFKYYGCITTKTNKKLEKNYLSFNKNIIHINSIFLFLKSVIIYQNAL